MIEIRKLQQGDLEFVRQNPLEEAVKGYPNLQPPEETSYTGLSNGKIIGVGGILILWEGVAEGWIILTKDILDFKITTYKHLEQVIDLAIKHYKLKRLQITVRTDFPQAIKMVEILGFKNETPKGMVSYCPDGCDAYLYARII